MNPNTSRSACRGRNLAYLACILTLAGCTTSSEPSSSAESAGGSAAKKYRIAVIPKGTTHEFWKSVHYGADQAAKEFDAEIVWLGPLLEQDREGQINVVRNFISQHVDGICLAPIDSRAFVRPVQEARDRGIPVVVFDSGLEDESAIVSFVATDNHRGGQLAADEIARRLPDGGNVVLLRYMVGSDSTEQRERGFLEQLEKHSGLKLLSSDQYSGDTPQSALAKAQQLLGKYGEEMNAIFSVCEPNAAGTLRALEDAKLAGKVVFVGFDPNQRMVQALAEGKMQGIVLQDPARMGYLAVKTMVEHLAGKSVEKQISTGEAVATPENMNETEIQRLLDPPQFED